MKIADNSREPCWNADGTKIAFLRAEFDKFTYSDMATKGIYTYDLASGQIRQHPERRYPEEPDDEHERQRRARRTVEDAAAYQRFQEDTRATTAAPYHGLRAPVVRRRCA